MSDLKEYLKCVLVHLRLTKHLSLTPTPQDVLELQDIDPLIQETEERIQNEDDYCQQHHESDLDE